MASYAYCHHLTERKHLNVPTKTSTSVNDLGAPEDGNLLSQLPKKKHFKKNIGYDETYDVIKGPFEENNIAKDKYLEKQCIKYTARMKFEQQNASMLGGIYAPGKSSPKPYKVGKKPFNKFDYLHSNGTGSEQDSIRYLKRQNIKFPKDAAGLKSTQFKRDKEDEINRRYPETWWKDGNKELLIHKVAKHQRWFDSPLTTGEDGTYDVTAKKDGKNAKENEKTGEKAIQDKDDVDDIMKIRKSIQHIVRDEIKDTGRGLGEYTYKLRHIRENPIYHVQSMPGFKPGIHTIDDPANAHVSKDVMRTYPAETMPIHHLKPTAGMLAWTQ